MKPMALDDANSIGGEGHDASASAFVDPPPLRPVSLSDVGRLPGVLGQAALRPRRDGPAGIDSWVDSLGQLSRSSPEAAAARLGRGLHALPAVGGEFLGFRLIAELGRGAFGRVHLARQGDLADRPVALKVSADIHGESQKLARLQHTHIVPVYSVHRAGPLQAVCMPYLGATTLADVVSDLLHRGSLPASGKGLVSTLHDRRSRTTECGMRIADWQMIVLRFRNPHSAIRNRTNRRRTLSACSRG
jgi:hypothetical protein